MPARTSEVPSPRPTQRGDAIIWRAFAAVALPLGIAYFFVGPDAETIIYQTFSVSALVATVVGFRRYRPTPSHNWWLFAGGLGMWCIGDAYWDCYRWILQTEAPTVESAEGKGATFKIALPLAASVVSQPVEEAA